MKINNRIIVILLVTVCALFLALAVISHYFILNTIADLEQKQATADMQRVLTRLNDEVENVAATCRNWAQSEDTYRFVQGLDPDYEKRVLADPTVFRNQKIDYVLYYNSSGKLVYSLGYSEDGTRTEAPGELGPVITDSIIPEGVPGGVPGRRGYTLMDGKPFILAGYPIAPSSHPENPKGTLVMVRQLDPDRISDLTQQAELSIILRPIPGHPAGPAINTDLKKMETGSILVTPQNNSVMEGTALITGIENTPTKILVVVDTPRLLYLKVQDAMLYLAGVMGILAAILIIVIRWPLRKYLVNPIVALDTGMQNIGESGDISRIVPVRGDDEIASLATSLNRMLGDLHSMHQRMAESESKFRALAETSEAGIYVFRKKVLYVNPAAEVQTGYSREELMSMNFWDFVHPDFQEMVRERGEKRWLGGDVPSRIEFRIIRKDGTERWIDASTTVFQYENEPASFSVRVDVTRQKQIEEALRENEEKFRALTENTPDIIFTLDLTGTFTYLSPQIGKFGFRAVELTGTPIFLFVLPDDRPMLQEYFSGITRDENRAMISFRILDKAQNIHWLEVNFTRILDSSGSCTGLQGMFHDFTNRRLALDAISLANKKLNLMYDITRHDILNKIAIVFGLVDMTRASSSAEERDLLLGELRDAADAISRQIALTRNYQEVGVKSPQWHRIRDVISRATRNFSSNGIQILVPIDNLEVYADPLIEKVIYNLVDNAIRYGKKLTTITFFARTVENGLEVICEDDGIGVDAGSKEKIFERGFGNNTGLGLFLIREILQITGITIRENGEPGKGARFVMFLPAGAYRLVSHEESESNQQNPR